MERILSVGEASEFLGVSVTSLRRWDEDGSFRCSFRTVGGHRRYRLSELFHGVDKEAAERQVVLYSRVSSRKQSLAGDLERQADVLRLFAARNGISAFLEIKDVGSGINFRRRGLKKLLILMCGGCISRIVVSDRDRFSRFGFELLSVLAGLHDVEITLAAEPKKEEGDDDMLADTMAFLTAYSCRTQGLRAARNRRNRVAEANLAASPMIQPV